MQEEIKTGMTFPFEDGMSFGSITRISNGYIGMIPNGNMFVISNEEDIEATFEELGRTLALQIVELLDDKANIVNFSVMVNAEVTNQEPTSLDGSTIKLITQMISGINPLANKKATTFRSFTKVNPLAGANIDDAKIIDASQLNIINQEVEKGNEVHITKKKKERYHN